MEYLFLHFPAGYLFYLRHIGLLVVIGASIFRIFVGRLFYLPCLGLFAVPGAFISCVVPRALHRAWSTYITIMWIDLTHT